MIFYRQVFVSHRFYLQLYNFLIYVKNEGHEMRNFRLAHSGLCKQMHDDHGWHWQWFIEI